MTAPPPAPRPPAPRGATTTPRPAAPADDQHRPCPVDTAEESVAGEEDPGASLDLPAESSSAPRPGLVRPRG